MIAQRKMRAHVNGPNAPAWLGQNTLGCPSKGTAQSAVIFGVKIRTAPRSTVYSLPIGASLQMSSKNILRFYITATARMQANGSAFGQIVLYSHMGGGAAAFGEGESPVEQKPYALFDFDGTLIRGDSIVRFLRYAHMRGLVSAGGLVRAGLCAALYGLRLLTAEEAKRRSLAFLKGRGEKEVAALAEGFCHEVLVPALYPDGVREMRRRSAEGAEILLISASPAFYLEPLKRVLPISAVIATRMDVEDGVYTGLLFGENWPRRAKAAAPGRIPGRPGRDGGLRRVLGLWRQRGRFAHADALRPQGCGECQAQAGKAPARRGWCCFFAV